MVPPTSIEVMENSSSPRTMNDVEVLLEQTRVLVPELYSAQIEVRSIESDAT